LHVGSRLSLPGFADQPLPLNTRMSAFRLLPETLRFFNEALIKWGIMLNVASLHVAAPFLRKAGAQLAFSSPM